LCLDYDVVDYAHDILDYDVLDWEECCCGVVHQGCDGLRDCDL